MSDRRIPDDVCDCSGITRSVPSMYGCVRRQMRIAWAQTHF